MSRKPGCTRYYLATIWWPMNGRSATLTKKDSEIMPMPETPGRPRALTLKDVAQVARVSPITVSRALRRPDLLKADTVARVMEAVARTGYIPNQLAGGLASRKSRLVAAIVPQITNAIFVETVQGLTDRLWRGGYQVLLGLSGYPSSREDELINAILSRRPDGVVLTGITHSKQTRQRLLAAGVPVVEVWDVTPTPIDMLVGFSHDEIGRALARFLLAKGYRRPGLIWANDERAVTRRQSLLATLAEGGIDTVPVVSGPAPSTFGRGREHARELLDAHPGVDCIVASSDPLAHGAMAELHARGLRIPQDVAVLGFGDFDFAAYTHPALSTVRIDRRDIGVRAAEVLLQRMEDEAVESRVVDIGFEVIERDST